MNPEANSEVNAEYVKQVRAKYGLTQQAFARLLGIGEASIARYEKGATPTKAMANLIRAAARPEFLLDCLERCGEELPAEQRQKCERIVYAIAQLNEKGEVMDINEVYELTLQREILNEKAALMIADAWRALDKAKEAGDEPLSRIYEDVIHQICAAKDAITSRKTDTPAKLSEVQGWIDGLDKLMRYSAARAA